MLMVFSSAAPADTSGMLPEPLREYAKGESLTSYSTFVARLSRLVLFGAKSVELFAAGVSAVTRQVGHSLSVFADLAAVLVLINLAGTARMRTFLRL
jgi:hypothetical protein